MTGGLVTADVGTALERLLAGGIVAIPTETVYGLGGDADDPDAVARIFAVKARPTDHPLIVHIAPDRLGEWAASVPDSAALLAATCWPGPLTLLLPRAVRVLDAVTGGRDTVGLRVPAHPMTQELLQRSGRGIAAPSANRFGRTSPTTAQHVLDDVGRYLDPARDVVLDGGPCPIGVESTIVDFCNGPAQILRAGGVTPEQVVELLATDVAAPTGPARASGMLESHYAPVTPVRLVDSIADARALIEATPGAVLIDSTDDLVAYARDLYVALRAADDRGAPAIVAVMPPAFGLGHAIRDRLTKAAAPRPSG
ncbi:MAG: L-threonylcarbamoyladenylate synthase [Ilumatobacteraceae bacterium]